MSSFSILSLRRLFAFSDQKRNEHWQHPICHTVCHNGQKLQLAYRIEPHTAVREHVFFVNLFFFLHSTSPKSMFGYPTLACVRSPPKSTLCMYGRECVCVCVCVYTQSTSTAFFLNWSRCRNGKQSFGALVAIQSTFLHRENSSRRLNKFAQKKRTVFSL